MCLKTKPSVGARDVALCLFLSTRSPSRLENTHCSPCRSPLLAANLLIHLWHYTFDLCRLSRSLGSNDSNDRHTSRRRFSADTITPVLSRRLPLQVSCNWNSAPSILEMKREQKVAIFCFEAAFERSARISNETTQRCVLSVPSVEGSPPSCCKSKSSPATLHPSARQHREALLSLVTAIVLVLVWPLIQSDNTLL